MNFKIRIFQLFAKILLKQQILNQSDTVWKSILKSDIIFLSKNIKVFLMTFRIEISLFFLTKVNAKTLKYWVGVQQDQS